jgi:hypothetical protein
VVEAAYGFGEFEAGFPQDGSDGFGRGRVFEAGEKRDGQGGYGVAALVEDRVGDIDDAAHLVAVALFVSLLVYLLEVLL